MSERSRRNNRSYVIDLIAIDPESYSTIRIPWGWLKPVAGAAAAALIGWMALDPGSKALALVLTASGVASAVGLFMVIRGTSRRRVFVSCHARLPLLEMELNQPNPKRFNDFIAYLQRRIEETHKERKLEKDRHVAGEMRMLRRLTEAGVFESGVYQGARARLLEKF